MRHLPFCFGVFVSLWLSCGICLADRCVTCHQGLSERLAKPVKRSQKSAHALAKVGCAECHGGDPQAVRGGPAHSKFPGHPAPLEIAVFCGRCHETEQQLYQKSGHGKIHGTKPANTCVDCHGSHDVGNPPELFRLSEYCGSCHGVEYLPALPAEVRKLIEATDRLTDALNDNTLRGADLTEAKGLQKEAGRLVHEASLELPASTIQGWIRRMNRVTRR
jgi:hypothetical protein